MTIWKSVGAKKSANVNCFDIVSEATLMSHYEKLGYNVQGFGGVQFFNPDLAINTLPLSFTNFTYFGEKENIHEELMLPRRNNILPLANLETIVQKVKGEKPYFLFINCSETHTPYDTPNQVVDDKYVKIITKLNNACRSKAFYKNEQPITNDERNFVLNAQKRALEWVDNQLEILFSQLPKHFPTLFIILSDHGDELGEFGRYGHGYASESVMKIPMWVNLL